MNAPKLNPEDEKLISQHQALWRRSQIIAEEVADLDLGQVRMVLIWALITATHRASVRQALAQAKKIGLKTDLDEAMNKPRIRELNMKLLGDNFAKDLSSLFLQNELLTLIDTVEKEEAKDA